MSAHPGPSASVVNLPQASLCSAGEFSIVEATVRPFEIPPSADPARARIVALCADAMHEPFRRVVYRFGLPGRIELEQVATPTRRFRLWTLSDSPHSGSNVIGFSVGGVHYDVSIGTIMSSGLIVYVASGRRHLAMLVSGADFRLGPATIDFDRARPASPVFEWGYPTELRDGQPWQAKNVEKPAAFRATPACAQSSMAWSLRAEGCDHASVHA